MLRYHLIRIFRPALLLVLLGIGYLTVTVYHSGGTWTGNVMSYAIVLQYWTPMTVFLLIGMIATTPSSRATRVEHEPFIVARPSVGRAILDSLARFVALMLPVVLIGIGSSLFLTSRIADVANASFRTVDMPNPLMSQTIWLVFLIGPLTGSAALIALSEIAGTIFWSNTLRVVVVGVIAFLDAINRLKSPLLSLSGTTLGVVQAACCGTSVQVQTETGMYWVKGAYWGDYVYSDTGRATEGPITATIAPSLIMMRIALLCLAISVMIGIGVFRASRLQTAHNESTA